ncbi:MAG: PEP-CTERM sorting domain-containing protein [Planctomycetales bacterium]|nr:PEP-CTERM sorting domain-containing protein [Planctomycetales bacterium]
MKRLVWYGSLLAVVAMTVAPANADLVGLWRFDNDVNPQPDSSGEGNNAEVVDATWANDPVRGGAMNFEGEGDNNPVQWLEVEDSDSLSIEETGLTIATWAYFTQFDNWNSIMGKTGESAMNKPSPYDMYTNRGTGIVQFFVGEGNGAIQPTPALDPPDVEEWVHLAVTLDEEGEVVHYLNGEENGTGFVDPDAFPRIDEDTNLFIGSRADGTTNMHGLLDDVSIFNHALTADEIAAIMSGDYSAYGVGGTAVTGDFDKDGDFDDADMDALSAVVRAGSNDAAFDLTGDGLVDTSDRSNWVINVKGTWFGDSNLDGEFNSTDFVVVFSRNQYEDGIAGNSGWGDGDWNGDGDFDSSDFVAAFTDGGYEQGVRPPAAVPEPSATVLALLGAMLFGFVRRRR